VSAHVAVWGTVLSDLFSYVEIEQLRKETDVQKNCKETAFLFETFI